MTKLSDSDVRECRQLWQVAGRYLDLASALANCHMTHARLRDACASGETPQGDAAELLMASAHLCSGAIRLSSLSEKLGNPEAKACRAYFKAANQLSPSFLVGAESHLASWLHFMLRDDVAHEEESKAGYKLRRRLVSDLKMSEAYGIIKEIKASIERVIRKDHTAQASGIVG